ncbi:MAG TPA: shikimate dehydrogenase, partial [Anaerolineae bacterium]|nr:shikimate dehydrogenase [Anaerolineae bacterium]
MKQHQITDKTRLVGIIGWPVDDRLDPAMHNAAFAELGIDWAYIPLPVQPHQLDQALKGLVTLNFVGVNIVAPHQQAVMRYIDELSEAARITGAVNTLHIRARKFYGYNTDATGFLKALQEAGYDPKGMQVAILGAGSAARAVIFSLARAKADHIMVFNRTAERAAFLVDDLAEAFPTSRLVFEPLNSASLAALHGKVDLVVNTTSVGMRPNIDACPWPADVFISSNTIFYDLVYDPLDTLFLQRARAAGIRTIDGLGMLVHQGVFAFEKWTGQQAPV